LIYPFIEKEREYRKEEKMEIFQEKAKACNAIFHEFDEIYHEVAWRNGLSDSAFFILYAICELGDGCLQKDICGNIYTSKQTVHSSIRKLEKNGYLELKSGRGRDKHIFLTEAGKKYMEEKILPVIKAENNVFLEMSKEEGDEFIRLSQKYLFLLQKNLQQINLKKKIPKGEEKTNENPVI